MDRAPALARRVRRYGGLFEFPELRGRWFAFRDARMQRRALEFLLDEGLGDAAEIRGRLAARLAVPIKELDRHIAAEHVQVPEWGSVEWHGLRFALPAPDFDADDPSAEQRARLRACFEYYRDGVPEGMRVEFYGNRVRIEPGAFGRRREVIDALAGVLAERVPDELHMAVGPVSSGLEQAREQYRRALLLDVPAGFVGACTELQGFEEEGALGTIHPVLKERWDLDRPW